MHVIADTRHVLLSDASSDNAIVGILSVTDFIRVLLRLHKLALLSVFSGLNVIVLIVCIHSLKTGLFWFSKNCNFYFR